MARKAREVSSTGMYAVSVKTNGDVFGTEEARGIFSDCLEKFLGGGVKGLRFAEDGAQMLISETERGISADMKSVMTSFSRSWNKLTGKTGKIFAGRFGSVPVETEEKEAEYMAYFSEGDVTKEAEAGNEEAAVEAVPETADEPEAAAEPEETAAEPETAAEDTAEEEPEKERGAKRWHDDIPVWML